MESAPPPLLTRSPGQDSPARKTARLGAVICSCGVLVLLALLLGGSAKERRQTGGGSGGGFIRTRGSVFVHGGGGGAPFLFNGFNAYWMMHVAAEPGDRQKVSDVFGAAAAAGLSVCRTWAFGDGAGDGALQLSPGEYDEGVFQGLDFVVSEAGRYGVRLILSLVNNFEDFGGRQQYVRWARDAGAAVRSSDDFYTDPVVRGYYRDHLKKVLTRLNTITNMLYKDDPNIMAWELINEPRCEADHSGGTVNAWAQEMAAYAKSLDSNHLLEVGMEGFYGDSMPEKKQYNPAGYGVGADFVATNLIDEVDFATIHGYPDIWLSGEGEVAQRDFVRRWMRSHWQDAVAVLKKPLVFAEFGKSKRDAGYSTAGRNAFIGAVYGDIYRLATRSPRGVLGGGLVWQVMAEGMRSYHDGYEIVLSRDASTAGVMARQSRLMAALAEPAAARDEERTLFLAGDPIPYTRARSGGRCPRPPPDTVGETSPACRTRRERKRSSVVGQGRSTVE